MFRIEKNTPRRSSGAAKKGMGRVRAAWKRLREASVFQSRLPDLQILDLLFQSLLPESPIHGRLGAGVCGCSEEVTGKPWSGVGERRIFTM